MRVTVIGGGNMGAAFAASFLQGGMLTASKLTVVEPLKEKHQQLDASLHCTVVSTLDATSASADLVFLAVKPQIYQEVCADLAQYLHENQMVVSIMAGVSLDTLQQSLLGHKKVVRAMPNLPAQIGKGVTVFLSSSTLSEAEVRYLRDLFATSGKALEVREERLIHAATALSGSGPGFLFYLIEAFLEEAHSLGFSPQEAKILVSQIIGGTLSLFDTSGEGASELREKVTSPGGTTAAGIESFEGNDVKTKIREGLRAAFDRSLELSS